MFSAHLPTSRYGRIVKAVSSGAAARLLSAGIMLVSLPLAVRYLGAERYGVWATITTTVVWINLLDLGIANTLTNSISRSYALGDKASAARYFTNALLITGSIAALVGGAFAVVSSRVNWMKLFNVSANVQAAEVRDTVVVAAALMLLGLPCNLGGKLLAGYQELHRNNYAVCAGAVASVIGLAVGIAWRVSMPVLFVMSVGCLTFASMANLVFVVTWHKPWLLPRPALIDRSTSKDLFNSGSSFFFIQMAALVVFSSDNIVVSHYLGAAEVTPYSVTWRLVGLAAVLQSLIFPALWPAYAEAYAKRDYGWIRRTFTLTMKGTVVLNLCCVAALVVFGRTLIRAWAGPAAVPTFTLLLAMGVWALISGFMSVESCLLAALNRTREQAFLSIVAAIVNIALSIALVRHIGSVGVIGGTILSYLLVLVVPQSMIVRSLFKRELAAEGEALFARRFSPFALRSSLFAKTKSLYSSSEIRNSDVANSGGSG
jgi:O-antigen/teichoic acid export membrane protein